MIFFCHRWQQQLLFDKVILVLIGQVPLAATSPVSTIVFFRPLDWQGSTLVIRKFGDTLVRLGRKIFFYISTVRLFLNLE